MRKIKQNNSQSILDSLNYTRFHVENYKYYPSYQFKQQRLLEVDSAIKEIKNKQKKGN
jgi:hypothetical protein